MWACEYHSLPALLAVHGSRGLWRTCAGTLDAQTVAGHGAGDMCHLVRFFLLAGTLLGCNKARKRMAEGSGGSLPTRRDLVLANKVRWHLL